MPITVVTKTIHSLIQNKSLKRRPIVSTLVRIMTARQYRPSFKRILSFLNQKRKILDIGAGCCFITSELRKNGFDVTPVDVKNLSMYPNIKPKIYDGEKLPYKDNSFDIGLLVNVIHHAQNPQTVLREALRVCKKVIVNEDSPKYFWEWPWLQLMDILGNFEFKTHPHHSPNFWKAYLQKQKLKTIYFENYFCFSNNFLMFGRYSFFVISKSKKTD